MRKRALLISFLFLIFFSDFALADTLGTSPTSIGGPTANSTRMVCYKYTPSQSGTVSSVSLYGRGTGMVSMAVYTTNSSNTGPHQFLAQSVSPVAMSSTAGWHSTNLNLNMGANTDYWFCFWGDSNPTYYYVPTTGVTNVSVVSYDTSSSRTFNSWPAVFANNGTSNRQPLMYATYVPGDVTPSQPQQPIDPSTPTSPSTPASSNGFWYVDKNAPGNNTGVSWSDAWKDTTSINWGSVRPGDIIYLSGGAQEAQYQSLIVNASGTEEQPIVIKVSQESGRNGRVKLPYLEIRGNWVTVSGAKSDAIPTNFYVQDLRKYVSLYSDTNPQGNINLDISHSMGYGVRIASDKGIKVQWLNVHDCGVGNIGSKTGHAIHVRYDNLGPLQNIEIAYSNLSDNISDGINMTRSGVAAGDVKIHHNVIERNGDDGAQVSQGVDVFYNIFGGRHAFHAEGHPDLVQTTGSGIIRIYNNLFIGDVPDNQFLNSLLYFEARTTASPEWLVYGNLGYITRKLPSYAFSFGVQWNVPEPLTGSWNKVVLANNTIVGAPTQGVGFWNFWRDTAKVDPLTIQRAYFVNNLIWDAGKGGKADGTVAFTAGGAGQGMIFSKENYKVEYNIFGGHVDNVSFLKMYDTPALLNADTGFVGNTNAAPVFVDKNNFDYRLAESDVAAQNQGINLANYLPADILAMMPDYNRDLYGNVRGASKGWDIGAAEFIKEFDPQANIDQYLAFHLDFNQDDFSSTNPDAYKTRLFKDQSSNQIKTDCQSAYVANAQTFDQCPVKVIGPDNSPAASFKGSLCDRSSDYLAVQKNAAISQMPKGTIAFWLYSDDNTNITYRVLDTYKLFVPRTYQFHRDGDQYMTFTINTDAGRETDLLTFPVGSASFGRWNHYALTWDGEDFKGYFNGVYFGQASMAGISSLDIQHYLGISALMHGQPRNTSDGDNCVGQYGAPAGDYVFPNAGFMTGALDDIRIYNQALTQEQMAKLLEKATSLSTDKVLSISKSGTGEGVVSGQGIGCGKHCAEAYVTNQSITLTATAFEGSMFKEWRGSCTGTGNCTVLMSQHKNVTAVFERVYPMVAFFEAEEGQIISPFVIAGGAISQSMQTTDPAQAGKALYKFTAPESGEYVVAGIVNAPSRSSNSFFVNIDTNPSVEHVWNMSTTGGFEERFVSWGGSATGGNPTKVFTLTAGEHTLIIAGREAAAALDSILIMKKGTLTHSLLGDISNDGKVTMYDAALVLRYTLGSSLSDAQKQKADMNADGKIDGSDVLAIGRKALGL